MIEHIIITDKWPEAISDGLTLSCPYCGLIPHIDYRVDDVFWKKVVPKEYRTGVVCLSCLDRIASEVGEDISYHLIETQFTGLNKTLIMKLIKTYHYDLTT
jgi:hypothetical protein